MYPKNSAIWPLPSFPETGHKNQIMLLFGILKRNCQASWQPLFELPYNLNTISYNQGKTETPDDFLGTLLSSLVLNGVQGIGECNSIQWGKT
jgi:hypothetical protein